MKLHVIHNEKKKLKCVFYALVIKNASLARSFDGGLLGFLNKHGGQCTGKITVVCFMGDDVEETAFDLFRSGLKPEQDFTLVDAGKYAIYMGVAVDVYKPPIKVELRVDWLKGKYANDGVYVWYVDNE